MIIFTIGHGRKTADEFCSELKEAGIRRVLDIRLRPYSRFAPWARKSSLPKLLAERCNVEYVHDDRFCSTEQMLDGIKTRELKWPEYEKRFRRLMRQRKAETLMDRDLFRTPTALMCSETSPQNCHRRLVAEYLQEKWGDVEIVHIER